MKCLLTISEVYQSQQLGALNDFVSFNLPQAPVIPLCHVIFRHSSKSLKRNVTEKSKKDEPNMLQEDVQCCTVRTYVYVCGWVGVYRPKWQQALCASGNCAHESGEMEWWHRGAWQRNTDSVTSSTITARLPPQGARPNVKLKNTTDVLVYKFRISFIRVTRFVEHARDLRLAQMWNVCHAVFFFPHLCRNVLGTGLWTTNFLQNFSYALKLDFRNSLALLG